MANEEHIKLLKRSIEEWNRWREEQSDIQPDLRGADLSGADLRRADLREAKLRDVDLRDVNLSETDLSGADLSGADLSVVNLSGFDLIGVDLIGANLIGANLIGANLIGANLSGANLSGANLSGADLREAKLREADLIGADLSGVDLSRADLSRAKMREARLREANLRRANLSEADLRDADLSRAVMIDCLMGGTILISTDLSTVLGLDTIRHQGRSAIDLNTVILPHGPARTIMLRGVGYPETVIEYYDSLFTQPIQFYSCFISYTQADEEVAHKLYTDLQTTGIRCFFAPHDLKPGDYYHKRIDKAIQVHDKLLLLLSEQSVQSAWVEHEVMGALGREKRERREILFPLRLDDTVMESQTDWAQALRDTRHIGDMTGWQQQERYQAAFQEVVRHLKVGLVPPPK